MVYPLRKAILQSFQLCLVCLTMVECFMMGGMGGGMLGGYGDEIYIRRNDNNRMMKMMMPLMMMMMMNRNNGGGGGGHSPNIVVVPQQAQPAPAPQMPMMPPMPGQQCPQMPMMPFPETTTKGLFGKIASGIGGLFGRRLRDDPTAKRNSIVSQIDAPPTFLSRDSAKATSDSEAQNQAPQDDTGADANDLQTTVFSSPAEAAEDLASLESAIAELQNAPENTAAKKALADALALKKQLQAFLNKDVLSKSTLYETTAESGNDEQSSDTQPWSLSTFLNIGKNAKAKPASNSGRTKSSGAKQTLLVLPAPLATRKGSAATAEACLTAAECFMMGGMGGGMLGGYGDEIYIRRNDNNRMMKMMMPLMMMMMMNRNRNNGGGGGGQSPNIVVVPQQAQPAPAPQMPMMPPMPGQQCPQMPMQMPETTTKGGLFGGLFGRRHRDDPMPKRNSVASQIDAPPTLISRDSARTTDSELQNQALQAETAGDTNESQTAGANSLTEPAEDLASLESAIIELQNAPETSAGKKALADALVLKKQLQAFLNKDLSSKSAQLDSTPDVANDELGSDASSWSSNTFPNVGKNVKTKAASNGGQTKSNAKQSSLASLILPAPLAARKVSAAAAEAGKAQMRY